jgi:hypothetical protein
MKLRIDYSLHKLPPDTMQVALVTNGDNIWLPPYINGETTLSFFSTPDASKDAWWVAFTYTLTKEDVARLAAALANIPDGGTGRE